MKPLYYIVSDLHLCDRGPRDNFNYNGRVDRFIKFLDWTVSQNAKLIILGDLFDFWQVNFSSSVKSYWDMLDKFESIGATYVLGNHDNTLVDFVGTSISSQHPFLTRATLPFEIIINNKKFCFLHGHEVDTFCKSNNPDIGVINTIISGILEDKNKGAFNKFGAVEDEFIGSMEKILSLWQKITLHPTRRSKILEDIENYRKSKNADIVVYGHTHEAGNIGNYHYNTGTWARNKDTFAEITDEGLVNLYQWDNNSMAIPFEKELK